MPKMSAKMQDLNWDDLRYVLAVARAQALAPASRWLRVDETKVARRLARAEASLGSKLFDRLNGTMQPTETGQAAIERAERMEMEFDQLKTATAGADSAVSGVVRVTSIPVVVNRLLIPALPALYSAHPRLKLEAIAEPRNASLTRRDADIALRLARPEREQKVIARRIGEIAYSVYAPKHSKGRFLPWITYGDGMELLPHVAWIDKAIKSEGREPAGLKVNDSEVALCAIRAGIGRSLLPNIIGDAEPELTRLSGVAPVLSRELWLLLHPETRKLARIKAVIEWIDETISRAIKSRARPAS